MSALDTFLRHFVTHQRAARRGGMERRAFLRACLIGGAALPFINTVTIERVLKPQWHIQWSNIEILRQMGRGNLAAQEAFAAMVTRPILHIIEEAPVLSNLYRGTSWTIPLVGIPDADTPEGRRFYDLSSAPRHPWDVS